MWSGWCGREKEREKLGDRVAEMCVYVCLCVFLLDSDTVI